MYKPGTFDGLISDLRELVARNRDGDVEDVTLAVDDLVSRHVKAKKKDEG